MKGITKSGVLKLVGFLLMIFVVKIVAETAGTMTAKNQMAKEASQQPFWEVLHKTADQVNARLPMMLDSETRLDSTMALGLEFHYKHTLINFLGSEVPADLVEKEVKTRLINKFCTSPDMEMFIKNDVTAVYSFYGKDGVHVATISANRKNCSSDQKSNS